MYAKGKEEGKQVKRLMSFLCRAVRANNDMRKETISTGT